MARFFHRSFLFLTAWLALTAAIAQAGISLDQRVSFQVNQVTLDALLEAVLKPAGLTSRKEGDEIVVTPAR